MIKYIFIFAATIMLLSCDKGFQSEKYKSSVTIPILKECQDVINKHLSRYDEKSHVSYKIHNINYILRSHPNIVGFVELKSNKISEKYLRAHANTFVFECYPISQTTINKNSNSAAEQLISGIMLNERLEINSYIVNSKNEIYLYAHHD